PNLERLIHTSTSTTSKPNPSPKLNPKLPNNPQQTAAMAPSIMERIQAKIEIFRLEQRYTRRRNRRSTFRSNAVYVDGEYVYQTPNSTGSSSDTKHSAAPRINALHHPE